MFVRQQEMTNVQKKVFREKICSVLMTIALRRRFAKTLEAKMNLETETSNEHNSLEKATSIPIIVVDNLISKASEPSVNVKSLLHTSVASLSSIGKESYSHYSRDELSE